MNISLEYFLVVAEEQSISRAAERVMVSQQDMSNHIRRLEKQYGLLFERRPKFALTPVGEAVLGTYRRVRALEDELEDRLRDLGEHASGVIRLGIHIARARILLPPAAARFHAEYPHVRLEVIHGDTAQFEGLLERGELHLFLGVNAEERAAFSYREIGGEPVYLIASETLLRQCVPGIGEADTVTLEELERFPLIFSPAISKTQRQISEFFKRSEFRPRVQFTAGDFDLQLRMAAENLGACFCPGMHLREARNWSGPDLRRLTVEGLELQNELRVVRHRRMYHPRYLDLFETILAGEAKNSLRDGE